jgi:hypothetical protein
MHLEGDILRRVRERLEVGEGGGSEGGGAGWRREDMFVKANLPLE